MPSFSNKIFRRALLKNKSSKDLIFFYKKTDIHMDDYYAYCDIYFELDKANPNLSATVYKTINVDNDVDNNIYKEVDFSGQKYISLYILKGFPYINEWVGVRFRNFFDEKYRVMHIAWKGVNPMNPYVDMSIVQENEHYTHIYYPPDLFHHYMFRDIDTIKIGSASCPVSENDDTYSRAFDTRLDINQFGGLKKLRFLDIGFAYFLRGDIWNLHTCPNLQTIWASECKNLWGSANKLKAAIPGLTEFSYSGSGITE